MEVLVAAVILAAGMAAVLRGLSTAVSSLDAAEEVLTVSSLMENTLAESELRSWPRREWAGQPGGRWEYAGRSLAWQCRSETLLSSSNLVLSRIVIQAESRRGPGQPYRMGTEWLGWQGAP